MQNIQNPNFLIYTSKDGNTKLQVNIEEETFSLRKFGNSEFMNKPTNFYNLDMIISVENERLDR